MNNDPFEKLLEVKGKTEDKEKEEMFKRRIIFCDSIIGEETTKRLFTQFRQLTENNDVRPITLYINSSGGDLHEGLAIAGMIDALKAPICTLAIGKVCSAALIIFAAGIRRLAYPRTTFLMHDFSSVMMGKVGEIRSMTNHLQIIRESILSYLSEKTSKDATWWSEKLVTAEKQDYWFDANEAKEIGLIDEVVGVETTF